MKLKELKRGNYFTTKAIAEPKENQVYIRGEYDRSSKKYECQKFNDISSYADFKGDKEIFTDFTF